MVKQGLRLGVAAALTASVAVLSAQTPAPAAQQPAAPAAPAPDAPQPTFRVDIDFVTTDVIVRNTQDQFVADLTKDDFEILEDGVKQDITSLTLVHGGRVHNLLAPPPPPAQEGLILPPSRPRNDTAGRIFLIIVDDLHLDFRNTGRIRDLFKRISEDAGPRRRHVLDRVDRALVAGHRSDLRPQGAGRGDQEDHRQRPEAGGHHPGRRRRATAHRSALPRARRVLDRLRHADADGEDQQPPQGGDLGQQRLRLQSVRRIAARRGSGVRRPLRPDARRGPAENQRHRPGRTSSPMPTWRASWPK